MDTQEQNQTQNQTSQVKLSDLNAEQSLEVLWQLMNKANKSGVFTIDESYTSKVLFDKLANALNKKN